MLNRKFADLRHAPALDPQVMVDNRAGRPQTVVRLGPRAAPKVKGGLLLGASGWSWASFLWPDRWYAIVRVFDAEGAHVADHVDIARPAEEVDGCWSFLDLKLDLILPREGAGQWVDQDDWERELAAGRIPPAWRREAERTVATIDAERGAGRFPPSEVRRFTLRRG